jgi:hypothetical protein
LKLHFRSDLAPDHLGRIFGRSFFDRGGFCFAFVARAEDNIGFLDVYFQNRFERGCRGRIALRPAKRFFWFRPNIEAITIDIRCGPAAFGVASAPIPLPISVQGRPQAFEVGASVAFPKGKGRMLRFRDGFVLRTNSKFRDVFNETYIVASVASGNIVFSKPVTVKIDLPAQVAEVVPPGVRPRIKTLWALGENDPRAGHGDQMAVSYPPRTGPTA